MAKKRGRPPKKETRKNRISVNLFAHEKELIERAAKQLGVDLSTWGRQLLLSAARQELERKQDTE